jgi:hypothetical protein
MGCMRRSRSQLALLAALATALLVSSATSGAAADQARAKPTLAISGGGPLTVKGSGFVPRERVTVRLTFGSDTLSRVPRAGQRGRFAVQFPVQIADLALLECSRAVMIVATGNRSGRSATFRIRSIQIPPPCGIAPQP